MRGHGRFLERFIFWWKYDAVMPGFMPGIHVLQFRSKKPWIAGTKLGHDESPAPSRQNLRNRTYRHKKPGREGRVFISGRIKRPYIIEG